MSVHIVSVAGEVLQHGTDFGASHLPYRIGNEFGRGQQIGYVLGEFNEDEKKEIPEICKRVIDGVKAWATVGADRAMNVVNTKPKPKETEA